MGFRWIIAERDSWLCGLFTVKLQERVSEKMWGSGPIPKGWGKKKILRKWRPIVKTCKKFSDEEKGYDEVA